MQRSRIFARHFSKREERERERVGEKAKERENGLSLSLSEGSVFEKEQKCPSVKSRFFLSFKNRFVFVVERSIFEKEPYFRGVLLQKLGRKVSKSVFLDKGHICRRAPLTLSFFLFVPKET